MEKSRLCIVRVHVRKRHMVHSEGMRCEAQGVQWCARLPCGKRHKGCLFRVMKRRVTQGRTRVHREAV